MKAELREHMLPPSILHLNGKNLSLISLQQESVAKRQEHKRRQRTLSPGTRCRALPASEWVHGETASCSGRARWRRHALTYGTALNLVLALFNNLSLLP